MNQHEKDMLVIKKAVETGKHDPRTCTTCRNIRIPSDPIRPWVGSEQYRVFRNSLNPINAEIDELLHDDAEDTLRIEMLYLAEKLGAGFSCDQFGTITGPKGEMFYSLAKGVYFARDFNEAYKPVPYDEAIKIIQ